MTQSLVCLVLLLGSTVTAPASVADDKVSEEIKERQQQVARAARMYRIEVYESFRLDRDEYNRRREIGDALEKSWQASDQTSEQADQVATWFENSRELVFETGKEAQFAAAPELPAKVEPVEEKQNKSLVSTEAPITQLETATMETDAPPAPPVGLELDAQATPASETTPEVLGPSLFNALGRAIAEAATAETATAETTNSEPTEEAKVIDPAALEITPMEKTPIAPEAKKKSTVKKSSKKVTAKPAK